MVPIRVYTVLVNSLSIGFGLGFLVALQLGPMSLFLVRSTLRGGLKIGLAIGGGIALVDALYAALGAAGVAPFLSVEPLKIVLGLLGAAVLVGIGARSIYSAFRIRQGGEVESEVATPKRAFLTSVVATASNPLTIASWAAIFAAASGVGAADSSVGAILLVVGVGLGSLTWGTLLATGTSFARRALGVGAIRIADLVAGVGMIAFGGVLGYATLQGS